MVNTAVVFSQLVKQHLRRLTEKKNVSTKMVSTRYVLALATLLVVLVNGDTDYCSIPTCDQGTQTLCKYPFLQPNSKQCGEVESSSLTQKEIQEIVDTHNKWRAYVASGQETCGNPGPQPAATNLAALKWDDELAGIAQTWADQCHKNKHDTCRDVERFGVNQNIAYEGSTEGYIYTWSEVMQQWYDEVKIFNRADVKSLTVEGSNGTAHYTQIVWAETKYLGCGGIRYCEDGEMKITFIVCNYGPGGNNLEKPVYKTS